MNASSYRDSFDERRDEHLAEVERHASRRNHVHEVAVKVPQYLFRLGREPVSLSLIEFRIIRFLSESPYKAYTRAQIATAVDTENQPVTEAALDQHIRTLRSKLGLFSDYVQSVPYIGYRFKP